jgi:hypothetical protein
MFHTKAIQQALCLVSSKIRPDWPWDRLDQCLGLSESKTSLLPDSLNPGDHLRLLTVNENDSVTQPADPRRVQRRSQFNYPRLYRFPPNSGYYRKFHFEPKILSSLITPLIEPIRVYQPRRVIVGILADGVDECLVRCNFVHGSALAGASGMWAFYEYICHRPTASKA